MITFIGRMHTIPQELSGEGREVHSQYLPARVTSLSHQARDERVEVAGPARLGRIPSPDDHGDKNDRIGTGVRDPVDEKPQALRGGGRVVSFGGDRVTGVHVVRASVDEDDVWSLGERWPHIIRDELDRLA